MNTLVREIIFWSKCVGVAWAAGYVLWYWSLLDGLEPGDMRTAAGVVAQLSGTMLGFVLAALAVLTTVLDTVLVRNMQRTGHFKILLRRMLCSIAAFGLSTVGGAIIIFLPKPHEWQACVLIGLTALAIAVLLDVCTKFWFVLRNLTPARASAAAANGQPN
ncbi:hypothetical protein [Massilia sp. Root1485]|uniref:hypothetical protein n=1 Tax=Massilia sp. Root1485 TaxID=1736472 RepID=UPI00070050DF|nr:hypothetical protein [Massilia sp. Root1485]KQZ46361.1 hypothetical protein ASD92_25985 [Massilia sp. Root1485]